MLDVPHSHPSRAGYYLCQARHPPAVHTLLGMVRPSVPPSPNPTRPRPLRYFPCHPPSLGLSIALFQQAMGPGVASLPPFVSCVKAWYERLSTEGTMNVLSTLDDFAMGHPTSHCCSGGTRGCVRPTVGTPPGGLEEVVGDQSGGRGSGGYYGLAEHLGQLRCGSPHHPPLLSTPDCAHPAPNASPSW